MDPLHAVKLIESGKQVGAHLDTIEDSITYSNQIGIQRWKEKYRVSVSKIAYENMAGGYFEIDEVVEFDNLNEAFDYLSSVSPVPIESLNICKGQKAFDPKYLYSEGRLREYKEPVLDQNEL